MADLDGFENEPSTNADSGVEEDPAAAFLAREQDQLAGIEDDDDFGLGSSEPTAEVDGEAAPQEDFDFLDDQNAVQNEIPQSNGPTDNYSAVSSMDQVRQEPEKIKRWREEQKELLEEKDAESEKKGEEWREAAKKELEDWYRNRDEQLQKAAATNRATQEAFIEERDEDIPGLEWERVARVCDFNPKNSRNTKDISRMRSILLHLKQSGVRPEEEK
ncbi:clathrin light chain B-like [Saccoglossus kowalevskii]|uniref:Clathrin light chain n=1 Tax=Saccoglossus kowalevskii TaxID=10224 RepID=A0ABM0GMB4_SACKO|nr:PREDICTED: clathrin light chain B-like [Saccoglossus kowalevskii]